MTVKLLMTWNIVPGREQEYFEFVVRDFVPGLKRLGIRPTEAWYTTYGNSPQILTGGVTESMEKMREVLAGEEWQDLRNQLMEFVVEFDAKVVPARDGFQM